MRDLRRLQKDALKLIDRIDAQAVLLSKLFTIDLVTAQTSESPVDTSQLISNYIVQIGSPSEEFRGPIVAGKGESSRASSTAGVIGDARNTLQQKTEVGQVIYVTNNADYLLDVNGFEGGSVASGFLERALTIAEAKAATRKLKLEGRFNATV